MPNAYNIHILNANRKSDSGMFNMIIRRTLGTVYLYKSTEMFMRDVKRYLPIKCNVRKHAILASGVRNPIGYAHVCTISHFLLESGESSVSIIRAI